MYAFQKESTPYSCLSVKELLSWSTEFSGRILMHMWENYFFMSIKIETVTNVHTNYLMCHDFEILALELKLLKTNWLIIGTYKHPSLSDIIFTIEIKNILTFYRSTHGNILIMGDFDMALDNRDI